MSTLFAFIFGSPFAAFLAAAGAVSVPIIIHLLNRRRYRVVTWAAMRFLLSAQKKNTRRMRVEQLVLLAVRTALILLLVIAMASVMPWAEEFWARQFPGQSVKAAPGLRRTHKVIVLDGSFSMATLRGDDDCFERAKALAVQLIREGQGGDGFSVVLMSSPARPIVSEPSDNASKVIEEIEGLRLPHGNADVVGALNAVDSILGRSPPKFEEREVYFLTDMQRSTWTARQSVDPLAAIQRIQARARAIFVDVGRDDINNVAITGLSMSAPLAMTGSVTPLTVSLHNYGVDPRDQVRIELFVGKARATANDAPFELRPAIQTALSIAPSQTVTLNFPYKFGTPGDYLVQVRLASDDLPLDDVRSAVVRVKDTVPVMLVNGKPAVELYDRATEFLYDALNPFQKGLVPRDIPARPHILSETQFSDAGLGDLTGYDCVFVCDVARLSLAEIRRLEAHVRSGGGVVFCLGPRVDQEAYNRLLYRDGKGLLPAKLLGRQRASAERAFTFSADKDSFKSPPLDAFAGDADRASLMAPRFQQYVRVELAPQARKILWFLPEARKPGAPNDNLPVHESALISWHPPLSSVDDEEPKGEEKTRLPQRSARGRVILLTTTANMDWSSWPVSPSYPSLMQEILRYAIAGKLRAQSSLVGDVLEMYLPIGTVGLDVAVTTPDDRHESTKTRGRDDGSVFTWSDTSISGVYKAVVGQRPDEHLFAVNVPTATLSQQACESDLTRTNRTELLEAYPGWDFQLVSALEDVVHSGGPPSDDPAYGSRGLGTVIARYALLAMLVLVFVEVVLAWVFGHYSKHGDVEGKVRSDGPVYIVFWCLAPIFLIVAFVLAHAAITGDFLGFLPETLRGGIETALNIPPPAPGEGSRWRLEATPYLVSPEADPWLAGLIAVVGGVLIVSIYWREGATASAGYKLLLSAVRIVFVLLALAVLLPQLQLWFERQGWPDVAIIIDDSRSMSATDQFRDEQVKAAADKLAQVADLSEADRLRLAQALLSRQDPDWLKTLLLERHVKVHIYHCSGRAARLGDLTDPTKLDELDKVRDQLGALKPLGESSQLGTAVRQVLNDYRGSSLSAIIMLSDGVTTEGEDLLVASRYARQVDVPLYLVGIGDAHEIRSLQLQDLRSEDSVFVGDRIVFESNLIGTGYRDLTVTVNLREKDKDKVLDSKLIKVDPSGRPVKIRLEDRPTTPGEKTYVVEVERNEADRQQAEDVLRLERQVFVREAKLFKVLYVEGTARYEYRYLKHLLERESEAQEKNKTIDLKVLLLDANEGWASQDKSAIAEFPSKVELNQFDVVILGDIDPRHEKLGEKRLSELADFVKERGGGMLMIAGENFSPLAFKDTPLKDVLPIEVADAVAVEGDLTQSFRPELTPAGRTHPIFRFSPDEAENAEIWQQLRGMYWWAQGYRIKPAAEILAVHPEFKSDAGLIGARAGQLAPHPIAVQHFVGKGRCLFFGFHETWRWRWREYELRFNQFWIQTVRYLARSRVGRTELRLDRQRPYRRGEPIKVTVRFPDDNPPPPPETEVKVFVERRLPDNQGTEGQTIKLSKVEGSRATYEAVLTRTPEGHYKFWLQAPTVKGSRPQAECKVLVPPGEMDRLRMNRRDMEQAALDTGGRFYTLTNADDLLDELPAGSRVSLKSPQPPRQVWNHALIYLVAIGLLSSEWVLRKRKHML